MFAKASIVALFAAVAAAVHAPVGEPNGNPITRPLNEVVPAGKSFTITWQPTTPNTVSILLLRGPSTNVVPIGAPIAEGIANSGSFVWTPSTALEADVTHYGIQLIDDVTGQYQYSTQFGISQDEQTTPSSTDGGYPVSVPTPTATVSASSVESAYPTPTATISASVTVDESSSAPIYTATVSASSIILTTGAPIANSSVIQPTKPLTVPSSLKTTATGGVPTTASPSSPPESTGAASALKAGLGLAGAVAGLVFML